MWAKSDHAFFSNVPAGPPGFFFTTTDPPIRHSLSGALLGAGIEYAFLPNWSAKIEYNYMDFGHSDPVSGGSFSIPLAAAARRLLRTRISARRRIPSKSV